MRLLESQLKDDRTASIPLVQLYPTATQASEINDLLSSIQKHGMRYPLFCAGPKHDAAKARRQRLLMYRQTGSRADCLLEMPEDQMEWWAVAVGNQRLLAAALLGYTHVSASLWAEEKHAMVCFLARACRSSTWRPMRGYRGIDR